MGSVVGVLDLDRDGKEALVRKQNKVKKQTLFREAKGIKNYSAFSCVVLCAGRHCLGIVCWCDEKTLSQSQSSYGGLVTKTTAATKRTKSRPNLIIVIIVGAPGEAKRGNKVIVI